MKKLIFVLAVALSSLPVSWAAVPGSMVHIGNGPTYVDFTGDGVTDLVMSGHRENGNAHSFEVVSLYTLAATGNDNAKQWNIVPIGLGSEERQEIIVSGGADCVLHDFRLLSGSGKTSGTLILADRELGETYASPAAVTFKYYSLKYHSPDEGDFGFPIYYFEKFKTTLASKSYCDVESAFEKELGLGER